MTIATIGIDKAIQVFQLSDGSLVEVSVMDTGGQERYAPIVSSYYKNADCCLLVYDITAESSFDKIKNFYINELKEKSSNIKKVLLLGNKTDLKDNRKVSEEMGAQLAKENNYIFKESSCKDNYNVSSAFETLIEMTNFELKNNNLRQRNTDTGKLTSTPNNDSKIKKNNCC